MLKRPQMEGRGCMLAILDEAGSVEALAGAGVAGCGAGGCCFVALATECPRRSCG
jgi:hypothetical protein